MASSSTQRGATTNKSILTPDMTLDGHEPYIIFSSDGGHHEYKAISCISYFPDGKKMISGSADQTIRRWDLQKGKEIEDAREVCEFGIIEAVGVSRDGRWVVTAGFEVKVSEVEMGIVRTFHKGKLITWIDISADSKLVVGGSIDHEGWIWRLNTGELVAGPFKFGDGLTFTFNIALRFRLSEDSRKLAVLSHGGQCLEVWNVQTQKLDVQKSIPSISRSPAPVLWTTKHKSIVTAFNSTSSDLIHSTIYEFDASTFKTVGAPFKGHTSSIEGLALSSDCVLLVSSSYDTTIKLWAFESRQLLASFDMESRAIILVLSPDSRQLAYTNRDNCKIYICNVPANVLTSIGLAEEPQPSTSKPERSRRVGLLNSDATRPVRRKPAIIPVMSPMPRPLPTSDQHSFLRLLRNMFSSAPGTGMVRTDESRNPLDFPATSPLPRPLIKQDENAQPLTTQSSVVDTSQTFKFSSRRLSTWGPFNTSPAIVHVPHAPGKLRYATAGAPRNDDDDLIRDEDYVSPPPSPDPGSRRGIANTGQHGSGRFCFCF